MAEIISPISLQMKGFLHDNRSFIFENDGVSGISYKVWDKVEEGELKVGGNSKLVIDGLVPVHTHYAFTAYSKDGVPVELVPEEELTKRAIEVVVAINEATRLKAL